MLDTREVRLSRICKQPVAAAASARKVRAELGLVDTHVRQHDGDVGRRAAFHARELANPVHRVVVVERQEVLAGCIKRIGLADELQRLCRVRGEDDDELLGVGVEEIEHREPRLLGERCRQRRCGIRRVRVAEQVVAQQLHVTIEQRLRHEIARRVVEIHVPEAVEQRILARAQVVERARRRVRWILSGKRCLRHYSSLTAMCRP
jgi:hypothetical protein